MFQPKAGRDVQRGALPGLHKAELKRGRIVKRTTDRTTCPECGSRNVTVRNLGRLVDHWHMDCTECGLFSYYRDEQQRKDDEERREILERYAKLKAERKIG
jgi:RNase P subunit RPR2